MPFIQLLFELFELLEERELLILSSLQYRFARPSEQVLYTLVELLLVHVNSEFLQPFVELFVAWKVHSTELIQVFEATDSQVPSEPYFIDINWIYEFEALRNNDFHLDRLCFMLPNLIAFILIQVLKKGSLGVEQYLQNAVELLQLQAVQLDSIRSQTSFLKLLRNRKLLV